MQNAQPLPEDLIQVNAVRLESRWVGLRHHEVNDRSASVAHGGQQHERIDHRVEECMEARFVRLGPLSLIDEVIDVAHDADSARAAIALGVGLEGHTNPHVRAVLPLESQLATARLSAVRHISHRDGSLEVVRVPQMSGGAPDEVLGIPAGHLPQRR